MNKKLSLFTALTAFVLAITFVIYPTQNASAEIADGTYEVSYEIKSNNGSTSIADGYFSKPAKLIVENGVKHIQLTVTGATMIKSLSAPSGPVTVVSDNGDTRTVKFKVDGNLSSVNLTMHIVVPDSEEMPGGYDTTHSATAVFNVSGLPTAGSGTGEPTSNDGATTGGAEENPPTGDESNIIVYALLLAGSGVALFALRKFRSAQD